MSKDSANKNVNRGLLISKTLIYQMLIRRAGGFLSNPTRLKKAINDTLNKLDRKQGGGGLTSEVVGSFRLLVNLVKDVTTGKYKMEKKRIVMILGAIFYFLTPIDIIPDVLPVLGFLDDASLLAWLFYSMKDELGLYMTWKNIQIDQLDKVTYEDAYELAQNLQLEGRSSMDKEALIEALRSHIT